ncbi:hypothetical protein AVEN_103357-1 [Araneus ventricosus]|uniref:Uncharacterized protein n=1 Tax=Araneus ventricosus TaxID=182803 RepID=A0A4Y2P6B0_ARAVE|nr:hypothetical protein AVEN_103357-1 [Araneus ventricosus]
MGRERACSVQPLYIMSRMNTLHKALDGLVVKTQLRGLRVPGWKPIVYVGLLHTKSYVDPVALPADVVRMLVRIVPAQAFNLFIPAAVSL